MKIAITFVMFVTMWIGLPCPGEPARLSEQPVVFRTGNWAVHRGVDSFSDEVSCTGIYGNDFSIQATPESLYFNLRGKGGVRLVNWRYDNEPVQNRRPTDIEKDLSMVEFMGQAFTRLLGSRRLRVQVFTVLDDFVNFDIDTSNIRAVIQNIRSGCPTTTGDAGKRPRKDGAAPLVEPLYKRTPEGYKRVN